MQLLFSSALILVIECQAFAEIPITPDPNTLRASSLASFCAPPHGAAADEKAKADLICSGFMQGLTEGMFFTMAAQRQGFQLCIPADGSLSANVAKSMLANTLREHPDLAAGSASVVTGTAILKRFGCSYP